MIHEKCHQISGILRKKIEKEQRLSKFLMRISPKGRILSEETCAALKYYASIMKDGGEKVDLSHIIENKLAAPDILAYLWLAIESRCNIIVSGAPPSQRSLLLNTLNAFIPSNEPAIMISEDANEIKGTGICNITSLYGSKYNSTTSKENVLNALRMRPARIIVNEIRAEEAKHLFMGANTGVSFATTMCSDGEGAQIVKKLLEKPMCVSTKNIGSLDIVVSMQHIDTARQAISSVSEYRWLSRAEINEGAKIGEEDMVQVKEIMKEHKIDKVALKESKLIACYSRTRGITNEDSLEEFERRAKLIEKSVNLSKSRSVETAIRGYTSW